MSVSMNPRFQSTCNEVLTAAASPTATIVHSGFDRNDIELSANSTVKISIASYQKYALVVGAASIDLTTLKGVNGVDQDCTGLKLQTLILENLSEANNIVIKPGLANPYDIWGNSQELTVPPGAVMQFYWPDKLADVAAGVKQIDLAGTGTDEINIGMTLG